MTSGGGGLRLTEAVTEGLPTILTGEEAGPPESLDLPLLTDTMIGQESLGLVTGTRLQDTKKGLENHPGTGTAVITVIGPGPHQGEGRGHPIVTDHHRLRQDIIEKDRETLGEHLEEGLLHALPVLLHPETGASCLPRPEHIPLLLRVTSLIEKVIGGHHRGRHPPIVLDPLLDLDRHTLPILRLPVLETGVGMARDPPLIAGLLLIAHITSARSTVTGLVLWGDSTRRRIPTIETRRKMIGLGSGSVLTEESPRAAPRCSTSRRSTLPTSRSGGTR